MDENSISVQLEIKTLGELQATTSGKLVRNTFYLQWVAEIDGFLCYDDNPTNKFKIAVYNKNYSKPNPSGHFMNGTIWNPQQFDPYFAQLNNNFRINTNFKNNYIPVDELDD